MGVLLNSYGCPGDHGLRSVGCTFESNSPIPLPLFSFLSHRVPQYHFWLILHVEVCWVPAGVTAVEG